MKDKEAIKLALEQIANGKDSIEVVRNIARDALAKQEHDLYDEVAIAYGFPKKERFNNWTDVANMKHHIELIEARCDFMREKLELLAKQEQGEPVAWVSFEEHEPPIDSAFDDPEVKSVRSVLVTNNICSKDRMGRHSHVWLAAPMKNSKGEWVAYTDSSRKIEYLTHWLDPFTTPQQRKPLTEKQIDDIIVDLTFGFTQQLGIARLARAIEAAHGIKE